MATGIDRDDVHTICPECGKIENRARGYGLAHEAATPKIGDLALCQKCGCISEFDENFCLVKSPNWREGMSQHNQSIVDEVSRNIRENYLSKEPEWKARRSVL